MMRRIALLFALLCWLVVTGSAPASAQEGSPVTYPIATVNTADALKGLTVVYVLTNVSNSGQEGEALGLDTQRLYSLVKLKLRESGIKIITREEWFKRFDIPQLYVSVEMVKGQVFSVYVNVSEVGDFRRAKGIARVGGAITWMRNSFGTAADESVLLNTVRDNVDAFCSDYRKANPKP
jgi:hypothetical protein